MEPRRPSSTKWTNFPKELTDQITDVFQQNFDKRVASGNFITDGRIYPEEVVLRVGLQTPGRLRQDNFEASIDYNPKALDGDQKIFKLVDIIGAFLDTYLEAIASEQDLDLPRTWQKHAFGEVTAYLKYSTDNTTLEAEADRILGHADDTLVKDQQSSEDALDRAPHKVKITKKNH